MTYIEFFDKTSVENICACLTNAPERVILIGNSSKVMDRHRELYRKMFEKRGQQVEFLFKTVSRSNLETAVNLLTSLLETYDDCVFDITGGDEILNVALGIVYARNPDKNIQIHRFNLRNNTIYDCDKDGNTIEKDIPALSIEENTMIYGGEVVYGNIDGEKTYKWDMNDGFVRDIGAMWNVCRSDVRLWNTMIGIFEGMEKVGNKTNGGLTVTADRINTVEWLKKNKGKFIKAKGLINGLLNAGVLMDYYDNGETLSVTYKNEQVKKCLTKAGQVLEMKVYVTAKGLKGDDGKPIYNDCMNGVVIDWDGKGNGKETSNEIDVMLMHNTVPVFISCKNGVIYSEELYKLNTVAERFGGKYSKKVLIATALSTMEDNGKHIRERADELNIDVIDDLQNLENALIEKRVRTLWC